MQEIKFRAWQPHNSLHRQPGMYRVDTLVFYECEGGGEAFLVKKKGEQAVSSEYLRDINLMQFTNQSDRRGIEIWEGDIVQWIPTGIIRPIVWSKKKGQWRWGTFPLSEAQSVKLKVIGNIYETPELLTP